MMQTALALPLPVPALIAPPITTAPVPVLALDTTTALMLFGLDNRGKPHGARFIGSQMVVEQAADLMDLYFVAPDTDILRELAAKLPAGRLFESGRAFVPFIKAELYGRLLAATGTPDTPRPVKAAAKPAEAGPGAGGKPGGGAGGSGAGDPPATRIGAQAPSDWSQIGIGSRVLAQGDEDDNEGYYAAKVILTKADDHFVLTWADYPDLPQFSRSRRMLALMHPEMAAEAG